MSAIIQIFGTKKCKDTQKAIRFFKERNKKIQIIDLNEKEISKGEMNSIKQSVPLEDLIDTESKAYKDKGYAFMVFDIEEELMANPALYKTPITRFGKKAAVGNSPEIWKKWADEQ